MQLIRETAPAPVSIKATGYGLRHKVQVCLCHRHSLTQHRGRGAAGGRGEAHSMEEMRVWGGNRVLGRGKGKGPV